MTKRNRILLWIISPLVVIVVLFLLMKNENFEIKYSTEAVTTDSYVIFTGNAYGSNGKMTINAALIPILNNSFFSSNSLNEGLNQFKIEYKDALTNVYEKISILKSNKDFYDKWVTNGRPDPKRYLIELVIGKKPSYSPIDNSVRLVENYLKQIAKDPDSLVFRSWSEITYDQSAGWLVKCRYSGRNSFGAMVTESKWFVIRDEKIVNVLDGDAYND